MCNKLSELFEDIKDKNVVLPNQNLSRMKSYLRSYPYIVDYFKDIKSFDEGKFICGLYMIYGWMPTILDIEKNEIDTNNALKFLKKLKKDSNRKQFSKDDLEDLKKLVNNSIVGVSKLLHFIFPNEFPIWDSKIAKGVYQCDDPNSVEKYIKYLEDFESLINSYSDNKEL